MRYDIEKIRKKYFPGPGGQAEFAAVVKVARQQVSAWERSKRNPTRNTLHKIASALGATVDDFNDCIVDDDSPDDKDERIALLVAEVNRLRAELAKTKIPPAPAGGKGVRNTGITKLQDRFYRALGRMVAVAPLMGIQCSEERLEALAEIFDDTAVVLHLRDERGYRQTEIRPVPDARGVNQRTGIIATGHDAVNDFLGDLARVFGRHQIAPSFCKPSLIGVTTRLTLAWRFGSPAPMSSLTLGCFSIAATSSRSTSRFRMR